MVFKVLAAVLAICVAQNVVYASPLESQGINKHVMIPRTLHWFGGVAAAAQPHGFTQCMSHLTTLWSVVSEARTLVADYVSLKKKIRLLKENCDKFPTEASKLICKKNVDEQLKGETNAYIAKVEQYWPKIVDILKKFKDCFFD